MRLTAGTGVRAGGAPPTVHIEATSGWASLGLREVREYRELLFFLAWRDIKVRYKQTLLGATWAILQPILATIVFTVFFGRLARVGSDGLPYPVFAFAGLLPWNLFAQGLSHSADSLVGSSNLIRKVYFPRVLVPASSVLSSFADFVIALLVLFVLLLYYGIALTPALFAVPFFAALATGTALGAGLWLSALNVQYRDVRHVVPFFIQMWLFVTPVIYPSSRVTGKLAELGIPAWLYGLNPMVGAVEGFRWAVFGTGVRSAGLIGASVVVCALLFVSGFFYFRRVERHFADIV
jgi:lipopolysaccharide transport system permease protein